MVVHVCVVLCFSVLFSTHFMSRALKKSSQQKSQLRCTPGSSYLPKRIFFLQHNSCRRSMWLYAKLHVFQMLLCSSIGHILKCWKRSESPSCFQFAFPVSGHSPFWHTKVNLTVVNNTCHVWEIKRNSSAHQERTFLWKNYQVWSQKKNTVHDLKVLHQHSKDQVTRKMTVQQGALRIARWISRSCQAGWANTRSTVCVKNKQIIVKKEIKPLCQYLYIIIYLYKLYILKNNIINLNISKLLIYLK